MTQSKTKTTKKEIVETVEEGLETTENTGRQVVRAYVGALGLLYDESKQLVESTQKLFNKAEKRGEKVETQTRQEAEKLYKQAEEQVGQIRKRFERDANKVENEVEDQVEKQIERLLLQMGVPTRQEIVDLGNQIDELTKAIDKQLLEEETAVATQPIANYRTLTVREVNDHLDGLTISELKAIKRYESAHDNRVTILREVDKRIEAMPITNYDELTVEEVEGKLSGLNEEELAYLKTYEQAHKNRVTMIEAIEREIAEREPAAA